MLIYIEYYIRKQTSSNREDAVYIAFYFAKNENRVKIDPCCADVCAFLSMLIRVILNMVMKF